MPARRAGAGRRAIAFDLADRQTLFARNATRSRSPRPRTRSSPSPTRRSSSSAPAYRFQTTSLGRGTQDRQRSGSGRLRARRATATRRSRTDRPQRLARTRSTAARHHAWSPAQSSATSRGSTHAARRRAGSPAFYVNESPPLSALVVDRGWLPAAGIAREPGARGGAALRRAAARAGVTARGARIGDGARRARSARERRVAAAVACSLRLMDTRQRQLHRRAGAEGSSAPRRRTAARRAAGRAVVRRRLWPRPACRWQACGMVDGSGLSLARPPDRARRSQRCSRRLGRPEPAAVVPRRRSPVAGDQRHASSIACSARDPRASCARKTGTTHRASALSGYVERRYVFVGASRTGIPVSPWAARRRRTASRRALASAVALFRSALAEQRHARAARAFASFDARALADDRRRSSSSRPSRRPSRRAPRGRLRASSRVKRLERARDHVRAAGQRALRRAGRSSPASKRSPSCAQLGDERAVVVVGEPLGDRLGALGPDALDLDDLLLRRRARAARPCRSAARGSAPSPSRRPGC